MVLRNESIQARQRWLYSLGWILIMLLMVSCSNGGNGKVDGVSGVNGAGGSGEVNGANGAQPGGKTNPESPADPAPPTPVQEIPIDDRPVTLHIYNPANYSELLWNQLFIEPIQKKYPWITLVHMKNEAGASIAERVTTNSLPDIMQGTGKQPAFQYKELGLLEDLSPLLKKYNFDLTSIEANILGNMQIDDSQSVYGLPIGYGNAALYFNKDLFDKFAVPVPTDGMTWDEIAELTKRMTRKEGDVQYRGFDFLVDFQISNNQLSLPFVDGNTNKAVVQTEGWQRLFNTMKQFYDIEGNNPGMLPNVFNPFLKDFTLAMFSVPNILSPLIQSTEDGMDWDMVTLPTFAGGPDTGIQPVPVALYVAQTSQYKDQAYLVISHLLSEEIQLQRSKIGEPSVLKNREIQQAFGSDMSHAEGRNLIAFVSGNPAPASSSVTEYDIIAGNEMIRAFKEFAFLQEKDLNTILREAEENINKKIEEQQARRE